MDSFESMKDLADDAISYERSMAHVRYDHDKVVLARALLIERARTARLRRELGLAYEKLFDETGDYKYIRMKNGDYDA